MLLVELVQHHQDVLKGEVPEVLRLDLEDLEEVVDYRERSLVLVELL